MRVWVIPPCKEVMRVWMILPCKEVMRVWVILPCKEVMRVCGCRYNVRRRKEHLSIWMMLLHKLWEYMDDASISAESRFHETRLADIKEHSERYLPGSRWWC